MIDIVEKRKTGEYLAAKVVSAIDLLPSAVIIKLGEIHKVRHTG